MSIFTKEKKLRFIEMVKEGCTSEEIRNKLGLSRSSVIMYKHRYLTCGEDFFMAERNYRPIPVANSEHDHPLFSQLFRTITTQKEVKKG